MATIIEDVDNLGIDSEIWALNLAANSVGLSNGNEKDLEQEFEDVLKRKLSSLSGDWELTWGPKVYKVVPLLPIGPPTNAWFVACSKLRNSCVVALAGTSAQSGSSWYQDFDVKLTVDWKQWVDGWNPTGGVSRPTGTRNPNDSQPFIAHGTAIGVSKVLGIKSTKASAGMFVQNHLQTLPPNYTIYVTGHSMGGALAPTVGLGLAQANMVGGRTVVVRPSAGASPGNQAFNALYKSQPKFRGEANVYNPWDIVPHAWCIQASQPNCLPNIYTKIFVEPQQSAENVQMIKKLTLEHGESPSKESKLNYYSIPGRSFKSQIPIPRIPKVANEKELRKHLTPILKMQHVDAYKMEFGVSTWVDAFEADFFSREGIGRADLISEGVEDLENSSEREAEQAL